MKTFPKIIVQVYKNTSFQDNNFGNIFFISGISCTESLFLNIVRKGKQEIVLVTYRLKLKV